VAAGTIRVTGVREAVRALNTVSRDAPKVVKNELKTAAEPVRKDATTRISRYRGSTQKLANRVGRGSSVFVRGTARKRSGKRGDFGRLQQRHLEASLQANQDEVMQALEQAMDRLNGKHF
jgi:hypothetical protein